MWSVCVVSDHVLYTDVDTTVHQRPTCHNNNHQALSVNPYFSIFGFYMFEYDRTHTTSIGPPCHVWSVTTSCAQIGTPHDETRDQVKSPCCCSCDCKRIFFSFRSSVSWSLSASNSRSFKSLGLADIFASIVSIFF